MRKQPARRWEKLCYQQAPVFKIQRGLWSPVSAAGKAQAAGEQARGPPPKSPGGKLLRQPSAQPESFRQWEGTGIVVPAQSAIQAALHPAAAQYRSNWKPTSTRLRKPWGSPGVLHYETTLRSLSVGNYFCCSSCEQGQANPRRPEQEVLHQWPWPASADLLPARTRLSHGEQTVLPCCAGCHHGHSW